MTGFDFIMVGVGCYLMIAVAVAFILSILQTTELYRTQIQLLQEDFKTMLLISLLWGPMAIVSVLELYKVTLIRPQQAPLNYGTQEVPDELRHPSDPLNSANSTNPNPNEQ